MLIAINGLNINYKSIGLGKSIILLHGWGGSLESLKNLGYKIKDLGFRVILIDMPGFGKSDKPNYDFSLDDYAGIVEGIVRELKLGEVIIFGHSFGGAVAIKLAVRKNVEIKKLVLCNSSGIRSKAKIKNQKLAAFAKNFFSLPLLRSIYPPLRKFYYYYILRNREYIDYPEIAGTFRKIVAEDVTPILRKIDIPTLLIWGEKDKDTPLEHAKTMKSEIAGCKLKIVKEEGHGLPKFKPEIVANIIKDFLEKSVKRVK